MRYAMIKSLQAGRGLASLAVAGFHLGGVCVLLPRMRGALLPALFRNGNAGVDFFFVLSGFIIMLVHERDIGHPERLLRYLRNRFVRVYPIYWLYTALMIAAILAGVSSGALPPTVWGWFSTVTLVRVSEVATPLSVAWTLFYEIAFYAIFATLIFNRKLGFALLGVWLAAVAIVHMATAQTGVESVWLSHLCLNFFIGMGACWLHTRLDRPTALVWCAIGGVTLVAAFAMADTLPASFFGSAIAIACGVTITGLAALESGKTWNLGPLTALGGASYTLYLAHVHIESPMLKTLSRVQFLAGVSSDILFVAVLGATVMISYALYLAFEVPLQRALRAKAPVPAAKPYL
jgi:exopolysaccharide production protein ExoZ